MTPTAEQIDRLIAVREQLTNRRDEQIDFAAVELIDVMLREVAPGTRNDVDLLLGRMCAQLPTRAAMIERETGQLDCNPAEFDDDEAPWAGVTNSPVKRLAAFEHCAPVDWRDALQSAATETGVTAEHLTAAEVAMLEARTDEQSGIVEHYASHTEGHG